MKLAFQSGLAALFLFGLFIIFSFETEPSKTNYKCLVQMINYEGEKAYVITSLIDPDGNYKATLHIHGDDDEWYHEITEWWNYFGKQKRNVDGITGATLGGGERNVFLFNVDEDLIGKGYKIRFETSVEDQEYHTKDLEIPLDSEITKAKIQGNGYIRYVRIMPN